MGTKAERERAKKPAHADAVVASIAGPVRAKELRMTKPGTIVAADALIFTSNYEDYEVGVTVREARVDDPAMRDAVGELMRISARDYREGKGPTRAEVEAVRKGSESSVTQCQRREP